MEFGAAQRQRARFVRWEAINGRRLAIRICKETGKEFADKTGSTDFADAAARNAYFQRRIRRGLAIIDTAMRWRIYRSDKDALSDLCNIIAVFADEDKKDGRQSW